MGGGKFGGIYGRRFIVNSDGSVTPIAGKHIDLPDDILIRFGDDDDVAAGWSSTTSRWEWNPLLTGAETIGWDFLADGLDIYHGSALWVRFDDDDYNTSFGLTAFDARTNGTAARNSCFGYGAGTAITTGVDHIHIGYNAGLLVTNCIETILIGNNAGAALTSLASGDGNLFIGHNAGLTAISNGSIVIGNDAVSTGNLSNGGAIVIGHDALKDATTSTSMIVIGNSAVSLNTCTGHDDVVIGYFAGAYLTDAHGSVIIGHTAAKGIAAPAYYLSGDYNVFIGRECAYYATTIEESVIIGGQACAEGQPLTGASNVIIGYKAGEVVTSGHDLATLGHYTCRYWTTGDQSVVVGSGACSVGIGTGADNVVVGFNAGQDLTSAASNVILGSSAALQATTASDNIIIGPGAVDTGIMTGSGNIIMGHDAGDAWTSSSDSVVIGDSAGVLITTGGDQVIIGKNAGAQIAAGTGNVIIGHDVAATQGNFSNQLWIHNADSATPLLLGDFSVPSLTINGAFTASSFAISGAAPTLAFYDTDCTDADINASIIAQATATGTGAENIDVTFMQQVAGTNHNFFTIDADGNMELSSLTAASNIILDVAGTNEMNVTTNVWSHPGSGAKFDFHSAIANALTIYGGDTSGDDLYLYANSVNSQPLIYLAGNDHVQIQLVTGTNLYIRESTNTFFTFNRTGCTYDTDATTTFGWKNVLNTCTTPGATSPTAAFYNTFTGLTTGIGLGIHGDLDVLTTGPLLQIDAETGSDTVDGVADNGGLFEIESPTHGLTTNDRIYLSGGDLPAGAVGYWNITKIDNDKFTLIGSTYAAGWSAGGTWQEHYRGLQVIKNANDAKGFQVIIDGDNVSGSAVTPSLRIGSGQTGFFNYNASLFGLSLSGVLEYVWSSSIFYANQTNGPAMINETASATNPVWAFDADTDTGVGRAGADQLSLIAGGVEGIRITETSSQILVNSYGGQAVNKTNVADVAYNPSVLTDDYIIAFTSLTASRIVTISTEDEDTGTATAPRVIIVKDQSGNCAPGVTITVVLESGGTIDGAANVVLNSAYESVIIYIDGTNGFTI